MILLDEQNNKAGGVRMIRVFLSICAKRHEWHNQMNSRALFKISCGARALSTVCTVACVLVVCAFAFDLLRPHEVRQSYIGIGCLMVLGYASNRIDRYTSAIYAEKGHRLKIF